jgi:hypothetical protein
MTTFSSQFSPVDTAFGHFDPIAADKLKFDVVSSFQYNSQQQSLGTPIIGSGLGNVKKQYLGVVVVSPHTEYVSNGFGIRNTLKGSTRKLIGYDYEVYISSNSSVFSPEDVVMKGTIRDTNVNTFTFPISDVNQDYFVLVTPYVRKTTYIDMYEPWETLDIQSGSPRLERQLNGQIRPEPSTCPPRKEEVVEPSDRLFGIFYTTRILRDRKRKIESHKKSKEFANKLKTTPATTPMKFEDIVKQRDDDINNIREYQKQFANEQAVPNYGYTEYINFTPPTVKEPVPTKEKEYEKVLFDFTNNFEDTYKDEAKKVFEEIAPIVVDGALKAVGRDIDETQKANVIGAFKDNFDTLYTAAQDLNLDLCAPLPKFNSDNLVKPSKAICEHELKEVAKINSVKLPTPNTFVSPWIDTKPDFPKSPLDLIQDYATVSKPTFKKMSCDLEKTTKHALNVASEMLPNAKLPPTQTFSKKESTDAMEELDELLQQLESSVPSRTEEEQIRQEVENRLEYDEQQAKNMFRHHLEINDDDDWSTITDETDEE